MYGHVIFSSKPECKIERYYTTGTQKKIVASLLMVIATIVRLFLKQWIVIFSFVFVKKLDLASLMIISNEKLKKKEKWMRFEKKVTQWDQIKINVAVKIYVAVKTHFSFSRQKTTFLQIKSLLQNIRDETIFSYVQNDLSVPDKQKPCFSNFPPIFKNIENWMRFEKKVTP